MRCFFGNAFFVDCWIVVVLASLPLVLFVVDAVLVCRGSIV